MQVALLKPDYMWSCKNAPPIDHFNPKKRGNEVVSIKKRMGSKWGEIKKNRVKYHQISRMKQTAGKPIDFLAIYRGPILPHL